MANHQSAVKRSRQNLKGRARNRHYKSGIKKQVKGFLKSLDGKVKETITTELKNLTGVVYKSVSKGIIPKKRASRIVSRLAKKVSVLSSN